MLRFAAAASVMLVAGCASYSATLEDAANNRKIICEAKGYADPVSGLYLRQGFETCVEAARANGFTEAPRPTGK